MLSMLPWLGHQAFHQEDFSSQAIPAWRWVQDQLNLGQPPLWCGQILMGHPLSDEGQIANFYLPVRWILFCFSAWKAQAVFNVLHIFIFASGTYYLARKAALRIETAFFAAATACIAAPVWESLRFNDLAGLAWAPWMAAGIWQALSETGKAAWQGAVLGGLAIGFALVGGHPALALFSVCSSATVALGWFLAEEESPLRSFKTAFPRLLLALGLAALVSGPQTLARLRYQPFSIRSQPIPLEEAGVSSIVPASFLQITHPLLFGHVANASFLGRGWKGGSSVAQGMFVGVGGLILILSVLALTRENRKAQILLGVTLFWALYALGPVTPLHGWAHAWPVFRYLRAPMKALTQWSWLLALAAAFGLEELQRTKATWPINALLLFAVMGAAVGLGVYLNEARFLKLTLQKVAQRDPATLAYAAEAYGQRCLNWLSMLRWHFDATAAFGALAAWALAALLRFPRALTVALALLVFSEHLSWGWQIESRIDESLYAQEAPLIQRVKAEGGGRYFSLGYRELLIKGFPMGWHRGDMAGELVLRQHVGDSTGIFFHSESAHGSSPAGLERMTAWQGQFIDFLTKPTDFGVFGRWRGLLNRGGVRWFAPAGEIHEPHLKSHGRLGDLWLYENLDSLPLARFADAWQQQPTWQAALEAARAPAAPDQVEAAVDARPRQAKDEVRIVSREDQHWRIHYRAEGPRLLVLASAWYPGTWRAYSEGVKLPMLAVDACFTGIVVPPGERDLDFVYEDSGYTWGLRLEWIILAVGLILLWL
jgi:hypothetical protein